MKYRHVKTHMQCFIGHDWDGNVPFYIYSMGVNLMQPFNKPRKCFLHILLFQNKHTTNISDTYDIV